MFPVHSEPKIAFILFFRFLIKLYCTILSTIPTPLHPLIRLNASSHKIVYILIFGICTYFNLAHGQEMHFSQLSQTQSFSNPAFTGIAFGPRVLLQYRNQYPAIGQSVNSGYSTYYASYDQFLKNANSGIGVQVIGDKFGDGIFSRYQLVGQYAYQARFDEYKALRIGLSASANLQQLDRSQLRFFDQIDPFLGFDANLTTQESIDDRFSKSYINVNAGLLYFTNSLYAGLSVRNLMPKANFLSQSDGMLQDMTASAQFGGNIWINEYERTALFPYLLIDRQYGQYKAVGNVLYQYKLMNLGLGGRYSSGGLESIILMMGFNLQKFRLSYSYDIHTGGMAGYSGGSHEIGFRILLNGEDNSLYPNEHKNILFCPDFLRN